jgi:hypothetical protein
LRRITGCLAALAGLAITQGQLAAQLSEAMATVLERAYTTALHRGDQSIRERTLVAGRSARCGYARGAVGTGPRAERRCRLSPETSALRCAASGGTAETAGTASAQEDR